MFAYAVIAGRLSAREVIPRGAGPPQAAEVTRAAGGGAIPAIGGAWGRLLGHHGPLA